MIAARANRAAKRIRHVAWAADKRVRYRRHRLASSADARFQRALAPAAVVSIDVFDTALVRYVPAPADVFEIAAVRLRHAGALDVAPETFRDLRADAERDARRSAANAGREEVTLEEIYVALGRRLPALDVAVAMETELTVERAVCVANPDIARLVDSLDARGRRVVFVSDTYLPEAFVAELLDRAGYGARHTLFVSNAFGATKERGTLLPIVARELDVAPGAIVHVGDNVGADVTAARRCGVDAYWYARPVRKPRRGATLADKVLDRIADVAAMSDDRSRDDRMLRDVSYRVIAPIFLGVVQWMVEHITSEPTDLVLFCARDGFFLNQIYQRFARYATLPPALYFEVSRRALVFPGMTALDKRALDVLCANNAPLPVSEYFARIGIDVRRYPGQLAACGLSADARIYDQDSRRRVRELFVRLEDAVLERARAERALMVAYLAQSGVFEAHDLVLIDIGWGGTLQQALAGVLASEGKPRNIRAYYLSTDERIHTLDAAAGPARAWFANGAEPAWMQRDISPGYWLLEIAFAAQHGTVLGYRREADGTVGVEHHVFDPQSANARASRTIHDASREVLDRWLRIFEGVGPSLPMLSAFARFQRFVQHPTADEARFFGDMVHVGGLGTTSETLAIAALPPLAEIARRPASVLHAYRESHWQLAFLQRAFHSNAIAHTVIGVREAVRRSRSAVKAALHSSALKRRWQ